MGRTKPRRSKSRRVEEPPIIAFFDEEGDVAELIVKGWRFKVPEVPIRLLRDVKLREIPEGAYVIPIKKAEGGIVYGIDLCSFGFCEVYLYRDRACLEVMSRGKGWEFEIGIRPFMNMFVKSLKAVGEETKLIKNIKHDVDGDYHFVYFTVPLNPEMTIGQAIDMLKRLFNRIDEEMEKKIAEFYEERLAAWRRYFRAKRAQAKRRARRGGRR